MDERELIEERLLAYIYPNVAATKAQKNALEDAIDAQLAYETAQGAADIPANVQSYSVGSYSVTLAEATGGADTLRTICAAARAILFNAGLLRHTLPVARRL